MTPEFTLSLLSDSVLYENTLGYGGVMVSSQSATKHNAAAYSHPTQCDGGVNEKGKCVKSYLLK